MSLNPSHTDDSIYYSRDPRLTVLSWPRYSTANVDSSSRLVSSFPMPSSSTTPGIEHDHNTYLPTYMAHDSETSQPMQYSQISVDAHTSRFSNAPTSGTGIPSAQEHTQIVRTTYHTKDPRPTPNESHGPNCSQHHTSFSANMDTHSISHFNNLHTHRASTPSSGMGSDDITEDTAVVSPTDAQRDLKPATPNASTSQPNRPIFQVIDLVSQEETTKDDIPETAPLAAPNIPTAMRKQESHAYERKMRRTKVAPKTATTRATILREHEITRVPVNLLPDLATDLIKKLGENGMMDIDKYAIQTLIVNYAIHNRPDELFGDVKTRYNDLLNECLEIVQSDTTYRYRQTRRRKNGRVDVEKGSEHMDLDRQVVERYNQLMDSTKYRTERLYRNSEAAIRYVWTRDDFIRFKEAFRLFGYTPSANRQIAEHVGKGLHPNHIQYFKRALKQRLGGKLVRDLIDSPAYDDLIAAAPLDDGRGLADYLPTSDDSVSVSIAKASNGQAANGAHTESTASPSITPTDTPGTTPRPSTVVQSNNTHFLAFSGISTGIQQLPKKRGRPPKNRPPQGSTSDLSTSSVPHTTIVPESHNPTDILSGSSSVTTVYCAPRSPAHTSLVQEVPITPSSNSLTASMPSRAFIEEMAAYGLTEDDFKNSPGQNLPGLLPGPSQYPSSSSTHPNTRIGRTGGKRPPSTLDHEYPSSQRRVPDSYPAHSTASSPRVLDSSTFGAPYSVVSQQDSNRKPGINSGPAPSPVVTLHPSLPTSQPVSSIGLNGTHAPSSASTEPTHTPLLDPNLQHLSPEETMVILSRLMQQTSELTSLVQRLSANQNQGTPSISTAPSSSTNTTQANPKPATTHTSTNPIPIYTQNTPIQASTSQITDPTVDHSKRAPPTSNFNSVMTNVPSLQFQHQRQPNQQQIAQQRQHPHPNAQFAHSPQLPHHAPAQNAQSQLPSTQQQHQHQQHQHQHQNHQHHQQQPQQQPQQQLPPHQHQQPHQQHQQQKLSQMAPIGCNGDNCPHHATHCIPAGLASPTSVLSVPTAGMSASSLPVYGAKLMTFHQSQLGHTTWNPSQSQQIDPIISTTTAPSQPHRLPPHGAVAGQHIPMLTTKKNSHPSLPPASAAVNSNLLSTPYPMMLANSNYLTRIPSHDQGDPNVPLRYPLRPVLDGLNPARGQPQQ